MQLLDFYSFIYDRQKIWHDRFVLGKNAPWTEDPILNKYKFCNAYRELDSATLYLLRKVINTNAIDEDKIFNIIYFRFFNWVGFFDVFIPRHGNMFRAKDELYSFNKFIEGGGKLFNEAYITTGRYMPGKRKHEQILCLMEEIGKSIKPFTRALKMSRNLKEAHDYLDALPMVGPFLAYQLLQDIQYMGFWKHDINSFVQVGPGSRPALDLLFPDKEESYEDRCALLYIWQEAYFNRLRLKTGKDWMQIYYKDAFYKSPYLSIGNTQAALCEYRKFYFLSMGKGRRRLYKERKWNNQTER